ncbi:hypothetical protein J7E38_04590 [Bacillus sp. ISL-35]|uniref:hypothetical protein n=1 Tax=Bacillus sp. ISL-35 TaxID=2819122 RepID=UPI001BE90E91|nr:hypothetical protein [Bacillus sp. ISL-35]MBT2678266.1 hypothetical protein [Bacillus sp. ISL-35]MBT2702447.1 hypothetical protein [Chryseobacterium sp. ISL-80]
MFIFNAFVFFTLSAALLVSIILIRRNRVRLSGMSGMIISMYIGMNIGLTSGILLGTVYRGDLFISTVLSMLIGAASGCILGVFFNTISSIEGLMSGIMGGMMGAMLGEMLLPEKSHIMINIFLTITLSALFLFKILLANSSTINSLKDIIKPAIFFVLLAVYLLSGSLLGFQWVADLQPAQDPPHHMKHP